jgi:hypothetical protein
MAAKEKLRNTTPHVEKRVEDEQVFYTVFWSSLRKVDKYRIITTVPQRSGISEIYYMDSHHRIHRMGMTRVWYGGLRAQLRRDTDPSLVTDERFRKMLEGYECYYRYTLSENFADMEDLLYFFATTYLPPHQVPPHSGRYEQIFLDEIAPDKIVTI